MFLLWARRTLNTSVKTRLYQDGSTCAQTCLNLVSFKSALTLLPQIYGTQCSRRDQSPTTQKTHHKMYKCVYNIYIYIYIYYFIFYNYPSCYITNYQKLVHGFLNKGYWWFRYWKYMCIMKDKNDTLWKTSYKKTVYSLYFPYINVYMIEF